MIIQNANSEASLKIVIIATFVSAMHTETRHVD
ncbi:MAG: hypothetical protein ACI86X_001302 [Moritella sp.]|jgi:hypothetical protein